MADVVIVLNRRGGITLNHGTSSRTLTLAKVGNAGPQGPKGDPGEPGAPGAPGASGVTDHGLLAGLTDDDHLQYLTNARGDSRYYTQVQVDEKLAEAAASGGAPSTLVFSSDITTDSDYFQIPNLDLDADGGIYLLDIAFRYKPGLVTTLQFNQAGFNMQGRSIKYDGSSVYGSNSLITLVNSGVAISNFSARIMKSADLGFFGEYTKPLANYGLEHGSFVYADPYNGTDNLTSIELKTLGSFAVTAGTRVRLRKIV